jgi:hypothetical protein
MKSILRKVKREQLQFPTKSFNKIQLTCINTTLNPHKEEKYERDTGASDKEHL